MWSSNSSGVSLMWHLKRLIKLKTFYDRQKCQLLEATLRSPKKTWGTEDSIWDVVKLTTGERTSSCFACHQCSAQTVNIFGLNVLICLARLGQFVQVQPWENHSDCTGQSKAFTVLCSSWRCNNVLCDSWRPMTSVPNEAITTMGA